MYVEGDDDELPVIIRPVVEIPKPQIVAPALHPPVVTAEVNQPVSKTVADVKPPEANSENPVPAPEPQKPVTVCLDAPSPGDGVSGVAFKGGYARVSDRGLAVWHEQGRSQQEFNKHIWPGLR